MTKPLDPSEKLRRLKQRAAEYEQQLKDAVKQEVQPVRVEDEISVKLREFEPVYDETVPTVMKPPPAPEPSPLLVQINENTMSPAMRPSIRGAFVKGVTSPVGTGKAVNPLPAVFTPRVRQ